jgi:UDP-N-acetyl-D-glucosamine dehydrogenase
MNLLQKIRSRKAAIGVIGLGYAGLPLAIEFCRAGFPVTGFDIDPKKIGSLKKGRSYIRHIDISPVVDSSWLIAHGKRRNNSQRSAVSGRPPATFAASTDFSLLKAMDCIIICVPTPISRNREPDMTYVFNTTRMIARHLAKGQLVILESTTYPGTTDRDVRAILEETGLKAGKDFHLAFSPERVDPGNKDFTLRTTPKIVGGYTKECLARAKALYDAIVDRSVPVSSTRVAESAKLLENIYRAVNIALVNELKVAFDKMDIDIWEVISAAKTKPFGFQPFYPGPGSGGHCIPIDPFYLTWKAREYDVATRFIELAGEINSAMPDYVAAKVAKALNDAGKPIRGAKVLMLGLAYKANIDDDRESPSYSLIEKLEGMGARVAYNDPYIPVIRKTRRFPRLAGRRSVPVTGGCDLILIVAAHDEYKAIDFKSFGIPVVDTRNIVQERFKLLYRA